MNFRALCKALTLTPFWRYRLSGRLSSGWLHNDFAWWMGYEMDRSGALFTAKHDFTFGIISSASSSTVFDLDGYPIFKTTKPSSDKRLSILAIDLWVRVKPWRSTTYSKGWSFAEHGVQIKKRAMMNERALILTFSPNARVERPAKSTTVYSGMKKPYCWERSFLYLRRISQYPGLISNQTGKKCGVMSTK